MVTCCVPLCRSKSDRKKNIDAVGKKITFHEFPSNKEKREKWPRAILRRVESLVIFSIFIKNKVLVRCFITFVLHIGDYTLFLSNR
ncbi:hypothetical protein X975_04795, partial [Stegodyphus mimosarum]